MTAPLISVAQVRAVAPGCDVDAWAKALNAAFLEFGINTPKRATMALAQAAHESGGFLSLAENLNYSVEALLAKFSRVRISVDDARRLGRVGPKAAPTQKANQQAIANLIYGGQWGALNLGNRQPGDGWRFRGRAAFQITGRANYASIGRRLALDLIDDPDQLITPAVGARAAAVFWIDHGLNRLADAGDFTAITQKINGGQMGADDRAHLLALATGATAQA